MSSYDAARHIGAFVRPLGASGGIEVNAIGVGLFARAVPGGAV